MWFMRLPRLVLVLLVLGAIAARGVAADPPAVTEKKDAPPAPPTGSIDERISRLIDQLGDDRFAVREDAQAELARIGAETLDALSEAAEKNPDIEIAARARYLVGMIPVEWTRKDDPAEIRQAMRDYDNLDTEGRLDRIRQLSAGGTPSHVAALCRLVRYERSQVISKRAALAIIEPRRRMTLGSIQRQVITAELGKSRRPAATWVALFNQAEGPPAGVWRAVANAQLSVSNATLSAAGSCGDFGALLAWQIDHSLPSAASAIGWDAAVHAEETVLEQNPDDTQPEIVAGLLRYEVNLYERAGDAELARGAMERLVAQERGDTETLVELIPWLIRHKAWAIIDNLATRFADRFKQEAILGYSLAQVRLAQDNATLAQQLADQAFAINPADSATHLEIAKRLQERGLVDWAVREFRRVIEIGPPENITTLDAQITLAELLHDRQDELSAAKVLEQGLATLEKATKPGNNAQNVRNLLEPHMKTLRAKVHYYYACQHAAMSEFDKEREQLVLASREDEFDADVLIALIRLPNLTPELRQRTNELIEKAARQFRNQIESDPSDPMHYNQLAWLLSNTDRNQEEGPALLARIAQALARSAGLSRHAGALLLCLGRFRERRQVSEQGGRAHAPHRLDGAAVGIVSQSAGRSARAGEMNGPIFLPFRGAPRCRPSRFVSATCTWR